MELAPTDGMYWDSRGEVYMKVGHYEEALFNFTHALTLSPTEAPLWRHKAAALRALGRTAEAEEAEEQAMMFADYP